MKLSIILPAHKEPYLQRTIDGLLATSELGDRLEVIAVWDGLEYMELLKSDPRVRVVRLEESVGMRGAINAGLKVAKGRFVMKLDAHCLVPQGFDRIMVEDCRENRVLVPRRYSLDEETWRRNTDGRPPRDSFYLAFPTLGANGYGLAPDTCRAWSRRMGPGPVLDSMGFEGSCWMADRKFFLDCVGLLDDRIETYGPYNSESAEISLNYWLGGGEVKVTTRTWYAHLRKMVRHYKSGVFHRGSKNSDIPYTWAAKHWINDGHGKSKPFAWLIDKFWPIPGWPDDWREVWAGNLAELEGRHG